MTLWPYVPVGDITEALEWRTEVIRAKSGEQRIQTRPLPRRTWNFNHVWSQDRASAARSVLRTASDLFVPDWTRRVYTGSVAAGLSVVVSADETGAMPGGHVVLFTNERDYEICEIASVASGQIVLVEVQQARSAVVYFADHVSLSSSLETSRGAGQHVSGSIIFRADKVADIGLTDRAQYRGHDILSERIVVGSSEIDEAVVWPTEDIDAEIGIIATLKTRTLIDDRTTMKWLARTAAEKLALRRWIFSRRGKLRAFWRSTAARDLEIASGISSSGTALTVYLPSGAKEIQPAPFDIEINGLQRYSRRVLSHAFGATVGDRRTIVLTLDASLGATHTQADIGRISFLRCLRFDSDRIEFLHMIGGAMSVAVPCIEVPVP